MDEIERAFSQLPSKRFTVEELIERLQSFDDANRIEAAQVLAKLGDTVAVDTLITRTIR